MWARDITVTMFLSLVIPCKLSSVLPVALTQEFNLSGLHWSNIGPNRGGRSIAVAGSVKRPFEYYFGATGGGLWKTTDGGLTWKPTTDGQIKGSSVGAVAVSESNPDIVYIGMGETELRADIIQGDGVYKSVDGGKTWLHQGLENTQAISRVRIDPGNPDLIFVAALGHPYGPNEERGIYRSADGGKSWKRVLFRSDRAGAIDLCLDPHNTQVLFASLWEVYRKPWTLSSGGPGSGLFKSSDGGETWTEITRNPGLPKGIIGKVNVSVSGADSNRVYANVEAEDGGLFRSEDQGATWTKVNDARNIRQRAFYFNRIQADPKDRDTIYLMNTSLYKSTDGGKTLTVISTPHVDLHDLWIAPDTPSRIISADDGGGSISINGGQTWTRERYPTGQFYHVATTKDIPYHICGAQQDQGSACVPSDGGPNLRDPDAPSGDYLYAVGEGEAGYVAPDPTNPNLFYAGDQAGILTRYDRYTGQSRNVQVNPRYFAGMPARDIHERWQWVFPIVFSPSDLKTLYSSSQHLWKTVNEGQSWEQISPDLTRADSRTLGDSGGPITKDQNGAEIYATIFAVAPSRLDVKTIWTGSDDGLVHVTRDAGKHWENITPVQLPKFTRISMIEASPHGLGSAYVVANRYEMDDRQPYIFRTADFGKTWNKVVSGIPDYDFVRAVREDPERTGLLFAATEHAIYVSFNNGAHWQSLSLNLPDTQVSDLVIQDNDLVISTHGRSFYKLSDITVLRQLYETVLESDFHLFKPSIAMRSLRPATIDYFLKYPADKVTIAILDAANQVVQTFAASAEAPASRRDPGRSEGLNRVDWDLRYPGAAVFGGMIVRWANPERGPTALPGNYQVQLTVDGKTQTQPLTIVRDPRSSNITDAALNEQFDLAMQVRDKTSQANKMVIQLREIKEQIAQRLAKTEDSKISWAGEKLAANLSKMEEELYQVKNRSSKDTLNYPIKLNNQLATLMGQIEVGDNRPTDQMYVVFHDLSAELETVAHTLENALKNDLAQFNELLQSRNLEPIRAVK